MCSFVTYQKQVAYWAKDMGIERSFTVKLHSVPINFRVPSAFLYEKCAWSNTKKRLLGQSLKSVPRASDGNRTI